MQNFRRKNADSKKRDGEPSRHTRTKSFYKFLICILCNNAQHQ